MLGDVADSKSVDHALGEAVGVLGGLDILVNNAGIGAQGTVEDNDDEEWRRVLDVNVVGMARVTRTALPQLRRSANAAIVNVCSIAATAGLPRRALYSASKGAVLSLTLAMAADHLREGIRVNCVNPGTADTPWIGRLLAAATDPEAERADLERRQPHGRLVTAEEVAAAIAYLASPNAGSTTGAVLAVDGGMSGLRLPPLPTGAEGQRAGARDEAKKTGASPSSAGHSGPEAAGESDAGAPDVRIAVHTRLKPGMAGEYEAAHREVPAELRAAIVRSGARRWTIWRSGVDLFHVIECENYSTLLAELDQLPVNRAWQSRMADYLEVVHDYSPGGSSMGLPVVWEL